VVIGVDAPLGLPVAFVESVAIRYAEYRCASRRASGASD
jgi:hypothetical protein